VKKRDRKHPSVGRDREADTADTALFAREMVDVARLGPDPRGRVRTTPQISAPRETVAPAGHVEGSHEDFTAPGVDRREIRKLKRGEYDIADRLDLHGLTAVEACTSVGRFIEKNRHGRRRCVCIVHGRGLHSEENAPVLKPRVRGYLSTHRSVLAFADAPRSDGGAGAVYVLLRK
jgi:DNA-nicking Smr family endonuclease